MRHKRFWTNEELLQESLKYETPKAFEKGSTTAYVLCRKRGLLRQATLHMKRQRKLYTDSELLEIGRKYKSLAAYRSGDLNAYSVAVRRKLNEILRLEYPVPQTGVHQHVIYRLDFGDAVYIGLSCSMEERLLKHSEKGSVARYLNTTRSTLPLPQILHSGLSPAEAMRMEREEIAKARAKGLPLLNQRPGGELGAFGRRVWKLEDVKAIASNFTTRDKFKRGARTAFAVAREQGWLEEVCKHMVSPYRRFTLESLSSIAGQYSTRGEFFKADSSAYGAAKRRGVFDLICEHMSWVRKRKHL